MRYNELIKTPEYWTTKMQLDLYEKVEKYMVDNNLNRTELAKKLGVSKGYVTQLLNGDSDHRISKLVELALSIGYYPTLEFKKINVSQEEKAEIVADVFKKLKKIKCNAFIYPNAERNIDSEIFCEEEPAINYLQIS